VPSLGRILVLFGLLAALAAVAVPVSPAAPAAKLKVTFVGDSISESIDYVPAAERSLRSRFEMTFDLATCRRLVLASCAFQGSAPPTALQAVRSYGTRLGDVLIVEVGYNEGSYGYRQGIDSVMRAALRQGADGVVWVTLRETLDVYVATNRAIRSAAKRWPQLVVADWNRYSAGRPWFGADGLHLTPTGAEAMARFLRPHVLRAASAA
jgi:hypothetical protein